MLSRALRRLQKESETIRRDPELLNQMTIIHQDEQDLTWRLIVKGPVESVYENEEYT